MKPFVHAGSCSTSSRIRIRGRRSTTQHHIIISLPLIAIRLLHHLIRRYLRRLLAQHRTGHHPRHRRIIILILAIRVRGQHQRRRHPIYPFPLVIQVFAQIENALPREDAEDLALVRVEFFGRFAAELGEVAAQEGVDAGEREVGEAVTLVEEGFDGLFCVSETSVTGGKLELRTLSVSLVQ